MSVSEIRTCTGEHEDRTRTDARVEALAWLRRQLDWENRLAQLRASVPSR